MTILASVPHRGNPGGAESVRPFLSQSPAESTIFQHRGSDGRVAITAVWSSGEVQYNRQDGPGLQGAREVPPYRLDALRSTPDDEPVVVVAHHADADRLADLGLLSTVIPDSGYFVDWDHFAGRKVVLLHQRDAHDVQRLAGGLAERAAYVVVVELPGWPRGRRLGELVDASPHNYDRAGILGMIDAVGKVYHPSPPPPVVPADPAEVVADDGEAINCTDLGNAMRLVKQHGHKLRYCPQRGEWLVWDGRRWREDATGEVYRLACKTVQSIGIEAGGTDDEASRRDLLKWALKSESRQRIDAMVALARTRPGIPVEPHQLDADSWLLNVQNGTLDLQTGQLRPHRQGDLITKLAPIDFDPKAKCPLWDLFQSDIFAGDLEMIAYVNRVLGYAMTGDTRVQELYIFHGDGANGKSALLDVFRHILGEYATKADSGLLLAKQFDDHPTGIADLDGRRFVLASETGDGRRLAESMVKSITGDDTLKARRMRQDFYEFRRSFKVVLATNHRPEIRGTDHGIWRRVRLVPFGVKFVDSPDEVEAPHRLLKIEGMVGKLLNESSGILNSLVAGCLDWQRDGMRPPKEVTEATETYREESDTISLFIKDRCREAQDDSVKTKASSLYQAYVKWCEDSGIKGVLSLRAFGQEMDKRGHLAKHENTGNFRLRIRLLD